VDSESSVSALFDSAVAQFGHIDAVFNNAGRGANPTPIEEVETAKFEALFKTNTVGMYLVIKYAFKTFKKQIKEAESNDENALEIGEKEEEKREYEFTRAKVPTDVKAKIEAMARKLPKRGYTIVNNSSLAAKNTINGIMQYTAVKHTVNGLTQSAALEGASFNIRVNAVLPGIITTPAWNSVTDSMLQQASETPIARVGTPEETAQSVVYLLSDYSSFVTGVLHSVDGGASL